MASNQPSKTRNLSLNELFDVLQEEYIVCELRSKIYPEVHTNLEGKTNYWKAHWIDLMLKKKQKIVDIAKKNSFLSIFDDKRIKADFDKKIIPEIGFPNFIYKDDFQKLVLEKWDIHNYYMIESNVSVYDTNKLKMVYGVINSVNLKDKKINVDIKNEGQVEFNIELVTRVF